MNGEHEELIGKLKEAIIDIDEDEVVRVSREVIDAGVNPLEAIEKGLAEGMKVVGAKFEKLEVFLTDLMLAAEAMDKALKILLPHIPRVEKPERRGKVVIGTVMGDIHELGKNIVATMLKVNGFEVLDLGVDVPASKFYTEAEKFGADIIAVSALMSSTIGGQKDVIDYLEAQSVRDKYIVLVGGGPTTQEWAEQIGADGYGETAMDAVRIAKTLLEKKGGEV